MELPEDFKKLIKDRLFHHKKAVSNPSAFTSIFFIKGYTGKRGEVHSAVDKEIGRLKSLEGLGLLSN